MSFHKGINTVNKLFSIARKGQLIIKDTEKVKQILTQRQANKAEVAKYLGPKTKSRNRFKAVES